MLVVVLTPWTLSGGQGRADSMRAALRRYKVQRAAGDWTSLETYTGFHEPVNDLAMALYHGYFPFPWATYRASQKSRMLADRVVQHPWVLAQATEANAGEVYPYDPSWPLWAALLDIKVATSMGVGVFCRDSTPGGAASADIDDPKIQEFKVLYEEHQILAEWVAVKCVAWIRDERNKQWIDPMLASFGDEGNENCAPALTFGQDEGDTEDGPEGSPDQEENPSSLARTQRRHKRGRQPANDVQGGQRNKKSTTTKRQALKPTQLNSHCDEEELAQYELERLDRIQFNTGIMRNLGLGNHGLGPDDPPFPRGGRGFRGI
jgi:hypothetical protein